MQFKTLKEAFFLYKEPSLNHRFICNDHIDPLIKNLSNKFQVSVIGHSVNREEISCIEFGRGNKRILFWSQMHGNESTTTKALFDLLNVLQNDSKLSQSIEKLCQIAIIPILNPDGARQYTRVNANGVDLNRDAQNLSQPESRVLRGLYDNFKPDFCFNLHGQRTIFGVGESNNPATISFLSPSQNEERTITTTRSKAMEVIALLNENLQEQIPGQVGIYDDSFNINCVGDTFQSLGTPTILFEAGHFKDDYARDVTREYIFQSLLLSIKMIANEVIIENGVEKYNSIPQNSKSFFDIIIRNTKPTDKTAEDIGIMYQEVLIEKKIHFLPKIEKIGDLSSFFGHKDVDANGVEVLTHKKELVYVGYENDFVFIKDELFSLK